MTRFLGFILGICGLVAFGFWGMFGPTVTLRYRLTIEIDTPEGVKSSSNVIQSSIQDDTRAWWNLPDMRNVQHTMHGEAVFVDLGQGKHVIALLATGSKGEDALTHVVQASFGWLRVEEYGRYQSMTGLRNVPARAQPTLVTFTDLTDPASAKVLYATGTRSSVVNGNQVVTGEVVLDRFSETFGAGYAFKRATLEMTTDPISKAIEQKLPWVSRIKGYLNGNFACNPRTESCLEVGHLRRI